MVMSTKTLRGAVAERLGPEAEDAELKRQQSEIAAKITANVPRLNSARRHEIIPKVRQLQQAGIEDAAGEELSRLAALKIEQEAKAERQKHYEYVSQRIARNAPRISQVNEYTKLLRGELALPNVVAAIERLEAERQSALTGESTREGVYGNLSFWFSNSKSVRAFLKATPPALAQLGELQTTMADEASAALEIKKILKNLPVLDLELKPIKPVLERVAEPVCFPGESNLRRII
jgi:hypothetical protein